MAWLRGPGPKRRPLRAALTGGIPIWASGAGFFIGTSSPSDNSCKQVRPVITQSGRRERSRQLDVPDERSRRGQRRTTHLIQGGRLPTHEPLNSTIQGIRAGTRALRPLIKRRAYCRRCVLQRRKEVRMPTMAVCKRALRRFAETWRGGSRIGWRGTDLRQPAASSWCQRRRTPPAQHHGHCADRSFRNYGPGNVTHDRRPQTVAVMERLMTSG